MTIALVAGASLAIAPPASAHAVLVRSEPSDGAVVSQPPRAVRLWFSTDVAPELSGAAVFDGEGRRLGALTVKTDSGHPGFVIIALPDLSQGVYSVEWRVLAEDDGHSSRGGVVFRVGAGPPPAAAGLSGRESPVSPLEVALRWADLAALTALAGAVAVAGWVLAPVAAGEGREARDAVRRARRRVLGLGVAAAGVALAMGVGLLARQAAVLAGGERTRARSAPAWEELLAATWWGRLWLVREALLVALAVTLLLAYRDERAHVGPPPGRLRLPVAPAIAVLVGSLALVHVFAGHAVTGGPNTGLTVAAGTVHVLAAGLWVGGLLALVVGWPRCAGGAGESAALTLACLRRFGRLALVGVGLVAATGLYYAGQEVASPDALLMTLYGRTVLGKTGLFLAAGAFGLANAVLLHRRTGAGLGRLVRRPAGWTPLRGVRSLVVTEACLGLLVLAGAGVLGAAAPARGPEFAPEPAASPAVLTRDVDDLLVTVSVRPNRPGPNVFEVLAASTRRPSLADIDRVVLRFTSPQGDRAVTSPPLARVEPGRYRLAGDFLSAAGDWRVDAVIERPGLGESAARFDWSLGGSTPPPRMVVSSARLEPALTQTAAVVLAELVLGGAWLLLRGRRRSLSWEQAAAAPSPIEDPLQGEAHEALAARPVPVRRAPRFRPGDDGQTGRGHAAAR